jgi:Domain of unknown function (DUF4157)
VKRLGQLPARPGKQQDAKDQHRDFRIGASRELGKNSASGPQDPILVSSDDRPESPFLRDRRQRFGYGFSKMRVHSPVKLEEPTSHAAGRLPFAERGVSGPGMAIPAGPRSLLEAQFGVRLDDVRLHTGPSAIAAARQLRAAAYTLGRDIAFGDGFYTPHTDRGLRLLSHELTHVVQSQNTPNKTAPDDELPEAIEPLEREARAASAALGQGKTTVRERLTKRTPLCDSVYISSHGEPGYLRAAAKFYTDWGYSSIQPNIPSIEAILKDLALQSSIGRVTIVSHAQSDHLMMEFIDGGPESVLKSDWEVDTVGKLTDLERHLVDASTLDQVINNVQANPDVLRRLGAITDPLVRQFIWWIVERVRAKRSGYPAEDRIQMAKTAAERVDFYRSRLLSANPPSGAGSGSGKQPAVTDADLNSAEAAVVTEAERVPWDQQQWTPEQATMHEQRLVESPSKSILRVMDSPEFFQNLAKVRDKISGTSWIEIQGCRAGKDMNYLKAVQSFFGGKLKPKVSAPDWYQVFGNFGWDGVPNSNEGAQAQWEKKGVPEAFRYWFPIIAGKTLPKKPTYRDLLDYLRAGHVLPLAHPGAVSTAHFLLLQGKELPAFLAWLSRHGYSITKESDIQKRLFQSNDFGENVKQITVDWLQENFQGPGQTVLRPSPEYDKHIIKVS